MVMLYVAGKKIAWADAEKLFAEAAATQPVEFHDESGRVFATATPTPKAADDPDWVKAITPEEIARRRAEPGLTFEELKKRLGWE